MLAPNKRLINTSWILALILLGIILTPAGYQQPQAEAQASWKQIGYNANIMPQVTFQYDKTNHYFELSYQQYYMRFRPFAIVSGAVWTQRQIVSYLRNQGATYQEIIEDIKGTLHWGFNITGIPPEDQANIDALGFKLTDYNFPLSAITVTDETGFYENQSTYQYKHFRIPAINLDYSFHDLYDQGFQVTFVNKTYLLITGVTNKANLLIDPITYSAPTITAIGGTLGSPITFWDLWNASNVNGWNVINNTQNKQFYFWCRLAIGDNSNPTYFNDTQKQITFDRSTVTANFQWFIYIYGESIVTFGELLSKADKRGQSGIDMFADVVSYAPYFIRCQNDQARLNLYASKLMGNATANNKLYYFLCDNGSYYDVILQQPFIYGSQDLDVNNLYLVDGAYAIYLSDFTYMNDVIVNMQEGGQAFFVSGSNGELLYRDTTCFIYGGGELLRYQTIQNYTLRFLDVISNNWELDYAGGPTVNAYAYREHRLDLNVTDVNGDPIENALVSMYYDGQGSRQTHGTFYTGSDGSITQQNLTMGYWILNGTDYLSWPDGFYNYNPYVFTIEQAGYQTYTGVLNITGPRTLTIAMLPTTVQLDIEFTQVMWIMLVLYLVILVLSFLRPGSAIGGMSALTGIILGLTLTSMSTILAAVMVLFNLFIMFKAIFWDSGG